ncbi:GTPase activating protein (GAP) for Rho1p [Dimargaris xerosporica]|nr:GTPase activating protein (GAP) for Rho1p [Dimargaris xerosporica]
MPSISLASRPSSSIQPLGSSFHTLPNSSPFAAPGGPAAMASQKISPLKKLVAAIRVKLKPKVSRTVSDSQPYDSPTTVFSVPLSDSIQYAGAQVDLRFGDRAKVTLPLLLVLCAQHLSEKGTETRGLFRISGSVKRIENLQAVFDDGPDYGATVDWSRYTVHDVASIFRRYLTLLPEPVIPVRCYYNFREVLEVLPDVPLAEQISEFRMQIDCLPEAERAVLLYVVSFLGYFSRFAEKTLMDGPNLAAIFQPGLLVHPMHTLSPEEYKRSQKVVEFLIVHHENFVAPFPTFVPLAMITGTRVTPFASTKAQLAANTDPDSSRPMSAEYVLETDSLSSSHLAQKLSRAVSSPTDTTVPTGHLSRIRRGRGTRDQLNGPPNVRRALTDYLYHSTQSISPANSVKLRMRPSVQPQSHIAPPPGTTLPGSPKKRPSARSAKTIYSSVGRGANVIFSTKRAKPDRPLRPTLSATYHLANRPHSQVVFSPTEVLNAAGQSALPPMPSDSIVRSPSADYIRANSFEEIDPSHLNTPLTATTDDVPSVANPAQAPSPATGPTEAVLPPAAESHPSPKASSPFHLFRRQSSRRGSQSSPALDPTPGSPGTATTLVDALPRALRSPWRRLSRDAQSTFGHRPGAPGPSRNPTEFSPPPT